MLADCRVLRNRAAGTEDGIDDTDIAPKLNAAGRKNAIRKFSTVVSPVLTRRIRHG